MPASRRRCGEREMIRMAVVRWAAWLTAACLVMVAVWAPAALANPGGNPPRVECDGYALYFKIDDITDAGVNAGTYTRTSAHVETNWTGQAITIASVGQDGQSFDWTSTLAVSKVVWKEGTTISSSMAGLPGKSGSVADLVKQGLSHVTFCGDAAQPTPTPMTAPTPTPTPTTEPVVTPTPTTEPVVTPTPTGTAEPVVTPTPAGTVEGVTGNPNVTPPPTDASPGGGGSTPAGLPLLALVLTGVALGSLALVPRRNRP
jgi:hypothetical protein